MAFKKNARSSKVVTPEARISYPNLIEPKHNQLNGKDEYSVQLLFDKKADLSSLKKAVSGVVVEQWGPDKAKWPKNLRLPFRDQADREKDGTMPAGMEKGATYISLRSIQRPGVVDANVQPILDSVEIYGGCYGRATVVAFAYDVNGNKGVSFGLQNVQKTRDGTPFSGRAKAEDDFEAVTSADSDFDNAKSTEDINAFL